MHTDCVYEASPRNVGLAAQSSQPVWMSQFMPARGAPTQTFGAAAERHNMRRKKVLKIIEDMMMRAELDAQFQDDQHSRAYHSGVIDGMGDVLYALSPERARRRLPIAIQWFEEDEQVPQSKLIQIRERAREKMFEYTNAGLFDGKEAD